MSEPTQPEPAQPEKPGRYTRSTGGLIGSMIVLVVAVLAIVAFRGTFRETPDYEPAHIDYLELISSVQQAGLNPLYPPELPDGWFVKDASFVPGDRPSLDLVFTTDDERTAGLHQEDTGERELLTKYVGAGVTDDDDAELTTDVATWTAWVDTDGDHAYTAEHGDDTVLVYSSGDPDALRSFVESLTDAPLTDAP
ncbi:hypothetical protein GCM10023350_46180 [Nocardioides endophyticus]|uniref:DUF4245 domain-containing protein n=1 Tax=Nocardioides endophyticus TaxID=1353775 RepID=A0ABP8ZFT1_9ACTN